jgi:hypothetical protein
MSKHIHNAIRYLPPLCLVFLLSLSGAALADQHVVRFAYAGKTDTAAYNGVKLGLEEANLQGKFLGYSFAIDVYTPAQAGKLDPSKYVAILSSLDSSGLRALAARVHGVAILNLTDKDDALRKDCIADMFHIIPSHAMERDAVMQWQKKHPDSQVRATAWDPRFVKYAGRDLNKRYKAKYKINMDELAWAGWAGARMVADVIVRGTPAEPAKVLEFLKTKLAFDGQKGLDMSFRVTGQLRQPLLLVENGKLLNAEAPVRGVVDPDDYDSLGIAGCSK